MPLFSCHYLGKHEIYRLNCLLPVYHTYKRYKKEKHMFGSYLSRLSSDVIRISGYRQLLNFLHHIVHFRHNQLSWQNSLKYKIYSNCAWTIFTARQRSCRKVLFSVACVCLFTGAGVPMWQLPWPVQTFSSGRLSVDWNAFLLL